MERKGKKTRIAAPFHYFVALATLLIASAARADVPPDATAAMFLESHNQFRARTHNLPPLEWDNKLARFAGRYADRRKGDCELEHSGDVTMGENIFQREGENWKPSDAINAWGKEEMKFYDPATNQCVRGECGHYLQVVWRDTTRVGCARVVCDDNGGVFMTCNYSPPGNLIGERPF